MDENILKKGKELMEDPDVLMDLFDFSLMWVSDRITKVVGFSKEEILGKSIMEMFALPADLKREKAVEHMSKPHNFIDVKIKKKDGSSIDIKVEFYTFEYDKGFYHIGKGINL